MQCIATYYYVINIGMYKFDFFIETEASTLTVTNELYAASILHAQV